MFFWYNRRKEIKKKKEQKKHLEKEILLPSASRSRLIPAGETAIER